MALSVATNANLPDAEIGELLVVASDTQSPMLVVALDSLEGIHMGSYTAGSVVRMSATFTVGGTDTDPTTITLKLRPPLAAGTGDQTLVFNSSAMVKDGVGLYHYDYTTTVSGNHYWRWIGTGTDIAAAEGVFLTTSNFV